MVDCGILISYKKEYVKELFFTIYICLNICCVFYNIKLANSIKKGNKALYFAKYLGCSFSEPLERWNCAAKALFYFSTTIDFMKHIVKL